MFSLASICLLFGQTDTSGFDQSHNLAGPEIIYYPMYNGQQLIEIKLQNFVSFCMDKKFYPKLEGLSFQNSSRIINPLILRDDNGQILATYHLNQIPGMGRYFHFDSLLPPDEAPTHHHKQGFLKSGQDLTAELYLEYYLDTPLVMYEVNENIAPDYCYFDSSGKVGILDTFGQIRVPAWYDNLWYFEDGYMIDSGGYRGILCKDYSVCVRPQYTTLYSYMPQRLIACNMGCTVISPQGKTLLSGKFDSLFNFNSGEYQNPIPYLGFSVDGYWGVMGGRSFRKILPSKYKRIEILDLNQGDFFGAGVRKIMLKVVDDSMKYALYSIEGVAMTPNVYQELSYYSPDLIRIRKNGKYGYINLWGIEIIEPKYDWVPYIKEPLILVRQDNKIGAINYKGDILVPIKYSSGHFENNILRMRLADGSIVEYSKEGKLLSPNSPNE